MKRVLNARQALQLYNSSPHLLGGFGHGFASQCEALDRHEDNPKLAAFKYIFQDHHRNLQHTVHGGALTTMVDVITTVGMLRMTAHRTVSISLGTEFLAAVKPGEEVEIETEVTKLGRNIVFTDCRIYTSPHHHRKLACKGQHIKAVLTDLWDFMKEEK